MMSDDGRGQYRSYLANEENFAFVKDLESRNLLVPIVGDFGGDKAIRAVGRYLKSVDAMVSAFYLSNVEQFLVQDNKWDTFCSSVATLPMDETSYFIRSGRGRNGLRRRRAKFVDRQHAYGTRALPGHSLGPDFKNKMSSYS